MNLSVAIATYNEEKNIARCLESVKGWVDEIVVVDGSSTDKTREIARKLGARVYKTTNKPIFHINKQIAIDKCRGKWILQLDADEAVSKELKEEILKKLKTQISKLKRNRDSEVVAYWIPRKNFFLGKWLRKTAQYPDPVIRFFQKGRAKLPCKSVHEQMEVEGEVGWLKGHLFHYPYSSFSEYLRKSNRYTSLAAQEMLDRGERPGWTSFFKSYFRAEKTFWSLFLRHKGFLDAFPGFVFSAYSGLHHITAYVKFWELYDQKRSINVDEDWEK
jgi:glycosyltransferase involved in cell wall biosynthesis